MDLEQSSSKAIPTRLTTSILDGAADDRKPCRASATRAAGDASLALELKGFSGPELKEGWRR